MSTYVKYIFDEITSRKKICDWKISKYCYINLLQIGYILLKNDIMKIKKYWFIIKAPGYDRTKDKTHLNSTNFSSTIVAVSSIEDACLAADKMIEDGIEIIELCGWFEKDWYDKIKSHIKYKIPVGYVIFEDIKIKQ